MTDTEEKRWLEDAHRDLALRAHNREAEFFKTNNDAAIKSGEEAVKALILINGGSSVAMLAFLGTLATRGQQSTQEIALLAHPLIWFALGVGLAVVAACFSYFTDSAIASLSLSRARIWQHPYVVDGEKSSSFQRVVTCCRVLAIAAAALSLASFGGGVWTAKQGFERLSTSSAPGTITAPSKKAP
ncbi:hypothetical protein [Bradyrhizobium japonicum]|uniref:hypothetical protein n=1 Tax=Bradyrhizobium japonicum TaxID=375 RepID=UPI0027144AA6|nr:hypothetical protein [Bradyrhizobium japonicum]WLB57473.1 hypothetical protein QIH94_16220 [Bradyrhizobium japonicum]WLB60661.1 hypothetical protein QIH96_29730 [Bradyrhizobium japonicum]